MHLAACIFNTCAEKQPELCKLRLRLQSRKDTTNIFLSLTYGISIDRDQGCSKVGLELEAASFSTAHLWSVVQEVRAMQAMKCFAYADLADLPI